MNFFCDIMNMCKWTVKEEAFEDSTILKSKGTSSLSESNITAELMDTGYHFGV